MNEPVFSPRSREDLRAIIEYVSRDDPTAAAKFIDRLKNKSRLLIQFPEMGAQRDKLASGLRAFVVANYVIYYTRIPDGVRIERVLHGAKDTDAILAE